MGLITSTIKFISLLQFTLNKHFCSETKIEGTFWFSPVDAENVLIDAIKPKFTSIIKCNYRLQLNVKRITPADLT